MQDGRENNLRWLLVAALVINAALLAAGDGMGLKLMAGLGVGLPAVALWLLQGRRVVDAPEVSQLAHTAAQLSQTVNEREAALVMAGETLKDENLERLWTTQSLEHQLRYANTIINAIGDSILVVSKAMNITRVNPAFLRATGYSEADLIGGPLDKVLRIAYENMALKNDPLPPALKEGRAIQDRTAYLTAKGGQITPVNFSLFPLRDQDKVVAGILLLRVPPKTAPKNSSPARP
jgi:PAS domain S-box-containing protein